MKRKILSLMLTVCMVLSLMPSTALADEVGTEETEMVSDETEKGVPTTEVKTTENGSETQTEASESAAQNEESQTDVSQNIESASEGDENYSTAAQAQKNKSKRIAVQAVEDYGVWINDFEFSSDHLTYKGTSGSAVYNPANKTLTLDNLAVTATMNDGAVI